MLALKKIRNHGAKYLFSLNVRVAAFGVASLSPTRLRRSAHSMLVSKGSREALLGRTSALAGAARLCESALEAMRACHADEKSQA